uniref:Uncharacterized protein n=1 Tax=Xenopus tropicalis TaxID=8364 RepID=A0A803J6A3_XENTR
MRKMGLTADDISTLRILEDLQSGGEGVNDKSIGSYKKQSEFTPNITAYSHIDAFVNLVTTKIEKIKTKNPAGNLNPDLIKALDELRSCDSIEIKPADKGGNVVLMDKTDYKNMVLDLLMDKNSYEILKRDPTLCYLDTLRVLLEEGKYEGIISKQDFTFMYNQHPTIATFYCLPKIQKQTKKMRARPIVSGNGSLTENVSKFVDLCLAPIVLTLP